MYSSSRVFLSRVLSYMTCLLAKQSHIHCVIGALVYQDLVTVYVLIYVINCNPGGYYGDEVGTVAIICRTNKELFDQAARICDNARRTMQNTRIAFAGVRSKQSLTTYILALQSLENRLTMSEESQPTLLSEAQLPK